MNTTITNIIENTTDDKVMSLAAKLMAWKGKRVGVTFIKKDKTVRNMVIVPNNNWNEMNGIESCASGRKMVATKCRRNMATVSELLEDGKFQPRTLNLTTITRMELV